MSVLRRILRSAVILAFICLLTVTIVLLSTTGQAFAAAHNPQKVTYASTTGKYTRCLVLQVHLQGNNPPNEQCLLARSNTHQQLSPQISSLPCNDHMPAPWVALYWDINYGTPDLCFIGTGVANLNFYDANGIRWTDQASSVNIGANGRFLDDNYDGEFPFHYGMQNSDLRTIGWNDRIAYVEIDS